MERRTDAVLVMALALAACGGATPHGHGGRQTPTAAIDPQTFAAASNAFGLDLWRALRRDHGAENFAFSPASVATALAMTYGGARGETAAAMAAAMHVEGSPAATMLTAGELVRAWNDPGRSAYTLSVANRLYGAQTYAFDGSFLRAMHEAFGVELSQLDFLNAPEESRDEINAWVSDATHERIPELFAPDTVAPDTRLVLVDAVYFHGAWETPFPVEDTADGVFHAASGDVTTPMMHGRGGRHGLDENSDEILELDYAGGDLSMLFVVPGEDLTALEDGLDAARVQQWATGLEDDHRIATVVPRFRIEPPAIPLRSALVSLGLDVAFSDDADFSGIGAPGAVPLCLSDVVQRTFVEVNEAGTEAAAATGELLVQARSMPMSVVIDWPFLFFLRDRPTGAILFAGRVVDPR